MHFNLVDLFLVMHWSIRVLFHKKKNVSDVPKYKMFVMSFLKSKYFISKSYEHFLKTYDRGDSVCRIMSFTNIFWYLRTVHKCFMERYFLLAMFVSLYGTAPWLYNHSGKIWQENIQKNNSKFLPQANAFYRPGQEERVRQGRRQHRRQDIQPPYWHGHFYSFVHVICYVWM